jgi:hydroxymethylbilane synthase
MEEDEEADEEAEEGGAAEWGGRVSSRLMGMHFRIGTRGSALARWQAERVASLLRGLGGVTAELVVISTSGDRVLDTPLPLIGGKGVFTAELESALREGRIDVAVHSLKDLPTQEGHGLTVAAIPERADPRDALVMQDGGTLTSLRKGAVVGTSSLRRMAQLRRVRPDVEIRDIRGNVDTRVRKCLELGEYEAIVLACAGLDRLGRGEVISERLGYEVMLPAPGQGALAVQCLASEQIESVVRRLDHLPTQMCVMAERAVLAALGGGCSVPVAAIAELEGSTLRLRARVTSVDGSRQVEAEGGGMIASVGQATEFGARVAGELLSRGAGDLLAKGVQGEKAAIDPP